MTKLLNPRTAQPTQAKGGGTDCPFCGHERRLRITGCVVCDFHALTVGSKDALGAMLIADLAAIAQEPGQRKRNKKTEVA